MNNLSYRMCVVTKQRIEKSKLIRIVLSPDKKKVELDLKHNKLGRGLYFQNSIEIIAQLKQKNLVSKIFKVSLPKDWYTKLESNLNI